MNIIMSGLDYHTAGIEIREKFSLPESHIENLLLTIKQENDIEGCVIISTCNRTEIYVTTDSDTVRPDLALQTALGHIHCEYTPFFITRMNDSAVTHLMETAAGLHSQIFGDDQIITQIKKALTLAHDAGTTGSVMETLFRNAITAGKRVKTEVKLGAVNPSVAEKSVETMEAHFGSLDEKKILVIGNGEMGRLAAGRLVERNALVTVTLREYKYKPVVIPQGCQTILFSERYSYFDQFDAILSATTSPHYTVALEEVSQLKKYPSYFMDIAVPRDIDPALETLGVTVLNVDSLKDTKNRIGESDAGRIVENYKQKFYDWFHYKSRLNEGTK